MKRSLLSAWFNRSDSTDPILLQIEVEHAFTWPPTFKVADYPGLIACELVRMNDGAPSLILTTWRDTLALDLRADLLCRDLKASRGSQGAIADVKRQSHWWPQSASDAFVKVSAVIGAVTVVTNLLASWLAVPNIGLVIDRPQPINASLGTPVTFKVLVLNNSRTNAADVDVSATSSSAKDLTADTPRVSVPGGGQAAVTFTMSFDSAGDHPVVIAARSRAGRLVPAQSQTTQAMVKAWTDYGFTAFEVLADRTSGTVGFIGSTLTAAQDATTLDCWVTAVPIPATVKFLSVAPSKNGGEPRESRAVSNEHTITIAWRAQLPRPFERQAITLNLESSVQLRGPDWSNIASKISPFCEVAK